MTGDASAGLPSTSNTGRTEGFRPEGLTYATGNWPRSVAWLPYLVLAGLYTLVYLGHPALPGNNLAHPEGWWGWWDQSLYLRSAEALGRLVLSPDAHWYPMGYSLLGAPWTRIVPIHPFFFVDLFALLGALFCFLRIARAIGIGSGVASVAFMAAIATDGAIFAQFVIPWNTTPAMLYIYIALAITLREEPLDLVAVIIAAICAALLFVTRPSDMATLAPVGIAVLVRIWRESSSTLALGRLVGGALAAVIVCFVYAAIHVRIYGFAPSPYLVHSGAIGLNFPDLPRKLYAVLINPRPYYGEGQGLFERAPWMILAVPALPLAMIRRNFAAIVISIVIAMNMLFYTSYTDFLPHGIWRYNNIHYLKLSYPLVAILCVYVVMSVRDKISAGMAIFSIMAVMSISYKVKLVVVKAEVADSNSILIKTGGQDVQLVVFGRGDLDYKNIYFDNNIISINGSKMRNIYDFRSIPIDQRVYIVFFRSIEAPEMEVNFAAPHGLAAGAPIEVVVGRGVFRLRWPKLP